MTDVRLSPSLNKLNEENIVPLNGTPTQKEMNFYDAIREIVKGSSVTRREWKEVAYCFMSDDEILLINRDGTDHQWLISLGDILGTDWIIVINSEERK